ncbi:ParB/RepB/Spo0J family partition protein [Owenweeksia hongkongensis]|uniref:ParB-like partition protein n=1 Tax=Owenweeksia hongkongensis (strain DSM 17368 / CIP 108786 / JCM 12287 / NRRL B-23963 / UST20020801) TaxID=926562 RepID=G8R8K9_OWEHD|nr:ParB/RepB/Spo0J family partition protein [Owenweeksia hongkongensis]AEV31391.1 ParB-like partition protein [Owenweeksia hongkongensis DSM 17368]
MMAAPKRKAMGRGLSALLKDTGEVNSAADVNADKIVGAIAEIEIEKIHPNPDQPRTQFSKEALEELAISIRELGIIQPITVRKNGNDSFTIISGERRYRASKIAGLETLPAYIRLADDQTMLEMALVENIQREELDSIEIALSYQRLIDECSLTQEAMSDRVGKKRSTVTNYLRLLKLQPIVQAGLRDKMISMGHARAIVSVENEEDQMKIYETIIAKDLSVRQVEDAVRKLRQAENETSGTKTATPTLPEKYVEVQENLSEKLESDVSLSRSKRGKGKIVIPFKNDKDFERILSLLNS